jgi:WD40 repeat protein
MVSWGGDYEQEGSIVIWNAQTREVIRHWTVAPKPVLSVSCSNDGDWLIAFSENGRLTKWNLATGEKLAEWELPEVELASVAVVPGSSSFIVGGTDKSGKGFVRLLDSRTGEILWRYDRPEFTVGQVAISPDGRTFAASSPKQGFRMWAFFRGSIESVVSRATHTCDAIAFSPDSAYVVVSGTDRTIYLEEIRGGWSALLPAGHQDRIRALAFSADGSKLLSGSDDLTVKFWDARGVPQQLTRWSRQRNLTALTVSADESILASGASDGSIELWETTAKHPQRRIHDHRDAITSLAVLNRGTQLISSSLDQHLILRDLKTGETLAKKRFDKLFPNSLAVSRDGKMVAVGLFAFGTPGKTQLLSLPNLEPLGEPFSGHLFGITGVRFANEDRDLITASGDDAISVWDIANHQLRFRLKHTLAVTCLNLSPDGKKLVSGAGQGTQPGEIRVWDLTTGKQLLDLGGHTREVTAVDWSLDGSRIVSGSGFLDTPAELKVWDARNGDELLTIPLAETGRVQLLFTPRIGQLITSVGERDRVSKLTVWQLRRDLPQKLYRGSPGYLKRVGYLNGEHELFAVDMLGNLTRWNRSTGELRPTEGIPIPKRGQLLRSDGSELLQLDGTQLIAWNLNRPFEEQSFLREFTDLDWGWHEQQRNHFFAAKDYRPALFHQQWLMRADPKPGEQKLLRELQDQLFERLPAPRELP